VFLKVILLLGVWEAEDRFVLSVGFIAHSYAQLSLKVTRALCYIKVQYQSRLCKADHSYLTYLMLSHLNDRFCDLVVRVPGYRFRGPEFDSRHFQIFWEVVSLERGLLSLGSTIEELLGRNSSGSGLEIREYGCADPQRWPRDTIHSQNLSLTSPKSCGRSVGIVRSRTKETEFIFVLFVTWTVLSLTASLSFLYHLCLVSPCPMLRPYWYGSSLLPAQCCCFNNFYVQPLCNFFVQDYNKIFYVIDERDIPPVQLSWDSGRLN
jgi:hypothetical protein